MLTERDLRSCEVFEILMSAPFSRFRQLAGELRQRWDEAGQLSCEEDGPDCAAVQESVMCFLKGSANSIPTLIALHIADCDCCCLWFDMANYIENLDTINEDMYEAD